ncbi:LamG-like jellyroll fold domain-containing protein [Sorangium sp. So ce385]|uniref:LamG-like jellyroll fold domain-containing protein n=1 Tax=Sorangium sp. So ce385 TaxID=3133308 RepID=UPI003F5C9539
MRTQHGSSRTGDIGGAPRAAQPDAAGAFSTRAQRAWRSRLRRATMALAATVAAGCADTGAPRPAEPVDGASAPLAAPLPSPVGLWHLDEDCSSVVVTDASATGAHGERHNGAGCGAGRVDRGATFDGADARIEIPDHEAFHFTTQMTAAAWVKPSSTSGLRTIVNKWYAMDSYALYLQDGQFRFSVAFPGGSWGTTVDVAAPATPGVWSHVAGVYDGTRVSLYVNGALAASATVSTEPRALQASTRPIVIGNHPSWNAYAGAIDEVRLYDVPLTDAQVKALTRNTYYVATNGLDTNPGTLAKPFATLAKAGQAAEIGDTVYVRGGTYSTSSANPVRLDNVGTEEEHIVLQPYPGESVVLDGSQGGNTLLQIRGEYYDILGFEIRNAKGIAIALRSWGDGDTRSGKHIRIAGNTIHGSFKGAVYPGLESTHMRFENNVVYDNAKINENNAQICHQGGWPSAVNLTRGHDEVVGNTIFENFGEGIGAYGTSHHVADNVLHDNYSVDLYLNNLADSIVERNFIYSLSKPAFHRLSCPYGVSCPARPTGDAACPWAGDLRVPAAATGIALANEDPNDVLLDNNVVRNNIVVGPDPGANPPPLPRRSGLQLSAWSGTGPSDMGSTRIVNNTVVCAAGSELFGIRGAAPSAEGGQAQVANNIFYQLRSDKPLTRFGHTVRINFASNNWFGGNGSSSPGGSGQSASDVIGNPLLVHETGTEPDDFRLQGGSPARNQGTLLPDVLEDFFGTPRPQEGAYDIGAHEVAVSLFDQPVSLSGRPSSR